MTNRLTEAQRDFLSKTYLADQYIHHNCYLYHEDYGAIDITDDINSYNDTTYQLYNVSDKKSGTFEYPTFEVTLCNTDKKYSPRYAASVFENNSINGWYLQFGTYETYTTGEPEYLLELQSYPVDVIDISVGYVVITAVHPLQKALAYQWVRTDKQDFTFASTHYGPDWTWSA